MTDIQSTRTMEGGLQESLGPTSQTLLLYHPDMIAQLSEALAICRVECGVGHDEIKIFGFQRPAGTAFRQLKPDDFEIIQELWQAMTLAAVTHALGHGVESGTGSVDIHGFPCIQAERQHVE